MLCQRTLSSRFASIIILGILFYVADAVVQRHCSLSVLTSLSMSPTVSPLAAILKWIDLRRPLTFINSLYVLTDVMTALAVNILEPGGKVHLSFYWGIEDKYR